MEQGTEGDEIILFSLTQIGCQLENLKSLNQITAEVLYEIVSRSLVLITGDEKYSTPLPKSIASRHRICTDVAAKIKELGFSPECGYNQLLYPSPAPTRILLTWLIQKLPRADDDGLEDVLGANALFNRRVALSLTKWRSDLWKLYVTAKGYPLINQFTRSSLRNAENSNETVSLMQIMAKARSEAPQATTTMTFPEPTLFEYHGSHLVKEVFLDTDKYSEDVSLADAQSKSGEKIRSEKARNWLRSAMNAYTHTESKLMIESEELINPGVANYEKTLNEIISEMNDEKSQDNIQTSKFLRSSEFGQDSIATIGSITGSSISTISVNNTEVTDTSFEEERIEREKQIEESKAIIQQEVIDSEQWTRKLMDITAKVQHIDSELQSHLNQGETLESEILIKKKTLELLPSAVENIGKLQDLCAQGAARLLQLAQEWETHRRPLIAKLRSINSKRTKNRNKYKSMIDEIKETREAMYNTVQVLKEKQEKSQFLAEEMKKMPKNINRSIYTHRILDIIVSIGKQVKEIEKITSDIRNIQKSINLSSTSLQRADAVAEDMIYNAANGQSNSTSMVEAYRQLRLLRSNFDELVNVTNKLGQLDRQARHLETKIDQETTRISTQNIQRILTDIDEVVKSNNSLVEELKRKSKS